MKLKTGIIIFLIVVESCFLFLMYKSSHNKPVEPIEEVKVMDETTKFIYMLEQNPGFKDYAEMNIETWPVEGYEYNEAESNCYDLSGLLIEDAISYESESNILALEKENAIKCYIYLDKKITNFEG